MRQISDAELKSDLEETYREAIPVMSIQQQVTTIYRPYYAPIKEIFEFVAPNSSVLEIGCGTGPILFLIERHCGIKRGLGIDLNSKAIQIAGRVNRKENLRFEVKDVYEIDKGSFDNFNVILCFDVFHHIPKTEKVHFLNFITDLMTEQSCIIIKDLCEKPWYKALANRITDFISTRSIVSYTNMDRLTGFFRERGLTVLTEKRLDQWIWNHFLIVAQK